MKNGRLEKSIRHDPFNVLLSSKSKEILYLIKRDLLDVGVKSPNDLWVLPKVENILKKQQENGSWKYSSSKKDLRSQENYDQLETYR